MAQILGSLSSYNSMANTCRMFKVLLKTIRISPQLVSYLKMGFSTKHWQKILKKEIFGQMSYFHFIFYLISSVAKLDREGVNLILAMPAFYLLLSSETSPSQRPFGPSLTLERKANPAIARFHKSRRRATSAKNAIWFCKKNLHHLTKTKKWNRDFFETSKAKLFLNLQSLAQQARKQNNKTKNIKSKYMQKPSKIYIYD